MSELSSPYLVLFGIRKRIRSKDYIYGGPMTMPWKPTPNFSINFEFICFVATALMLCTSATNFAHATLYLHIV